MYPYKMWAKVNILDQKKCFSIILLTLFIFLKSIRMWLVWYLMKKPLFFEPGSGLNALSLGEGRERTADTVSNGVLPPCDLLREFYKSNRDIFFFIWNMEFCR